MLKFLYGTVIANVRTDTCKLTLSYRRQGLLLECGHPSEYDSLISIDFICSKLPIEREGFDPTNDGLSVVLEESGDFHIHRICQIRARYESELVNEANIYK